MTQRTLRCRPIAPRVWNGRYKRVPGDTTTFHIRHINRAWWPVVDWAIQDEKATCPMVDGSDVDVLVDAVNNGKAALGGGPGGGFLLDEHGRVLVPPQDTRRGRVVVVGECSGPLRFHNSFKPGDIFDLYDDHGLTCGDPWDRPYIGVPHNLSAYGELYFWQEDTAGGHVVPPPVQDTRLRAALRALRPYGAVRFLVGPGGVAITKVPPRWEPRYVTRVDLTKWYPKEKVL